MSNAHPGGPLFLSADVNPQRRIRQVCVIVLWTWSYQYTFVVVVILIADVPVQTSIDLNR